MVGHDKVEAAIGLWVHLGQGARGLPGLGMIQRLQHQLAPAALSRHRPQRAVAVEHGGGQTVLVDPQPTAARQAVAPGHHLGPVFPVARGGVPGAVLHLVAVRAQQERPVVTRTAEDDERAHGKGPVHRRLKMPLPGRWKGWRERPREAISYSTRHHSDK